MVVMFIAGIEGRLCSHRSEAVKKRGGSGGGERPRVKQLFTVRYRICSEELFLFRGLNLEVPSAEA